MSARNSSFLTSNSHNESLNLKNILLETGIRLSSNTEDYHTLTQEQALVVRDLEKIVTTECTQNFILDLKQLCSQEHLFRKALTHTILKKSGIEIQQESLFRLLLHVDCLQKEITTILLDEITSTASEEQEDTSWLRLLLGPLRYLPYIKDAHELSTNLINILEIATFSAQLEILDSIPKIIPDSQYNLVAKELSKLLDDNDELGAAIIDCLNALGNNLENEIRSQVRDTILSKICAGSSLKNFPILLEFLVSNIKNQNLCETTIKIRNALDSFLITNKTKENESNIIVIFSRLQTFATASSAIVEAWLNMISSIKTHSDHKPIDLLILFMLHSCIKFKRKIIEAIFRKRVQMGFFKIILIEKLFTDYIPQQLMKNYFSSMVEIASNLLTNKDFSTILFVTLFNHKFTEIIQRQEILDCLIVHTGITNEKIGVILTIFSQFLKDLTKLQRHTSTLMGLLEKIDTFDLNDVKQVFEILCTLTCRDETNNLKDEIHMIIRKQLSSSLKTIKSRGIISAVIMAKHLAIKNDEENTNNCDESITIADLQGTTKDAAILLELVNVSTSNCPNLLGLYYDQLSNMLIETENLDSSFILWLYETVTNNFQNIFITETIPENINDLQFIIKYILNSTEEIDTQIFVNFKTNQILLLAPHFRLLRLLHYRQQNGDLSSIDALLGCGIILPDTNQMHDLDVEQLKIVADCLYHCGNWFREIINGFVTQKNKKLRQKVVQRLDDLIEVENLLKECMDLIPDHKLPICYFDVQKQYSPIKEYKKNTKKKFKSNNTVNESTSSRVNLKKSSSNSEQIITFREIDTDILILLKYPLKCDENDEIPTQLTQSSTNSQTTILNLNQFIFLMKDFVTKLTIITQNKSTNYHLVVPISLITDCARILPLIDHHLKTIIRNLDKILENNDKLSEDGINLKQSFSLILETFYLIFSWSGFQHSSNMELLRKILRCLRIEQTQTLHSTNRLIAEFITRLANYTIYCLHLSHAVFLVKTMQTLYGLTTPSSDIKKEITTTSYKLLNKKWYNLQGNLDTGKISNSNIAELVNVYLDVASIKVLNGIVITLQQQVVNLKSKEDNLEVLKSIDKQKFHILYQSICNCLQKRVKYEIQAITNEEHLIVWQNIANVMQGLMNIAKIHETKVNLLCYLKKSIAILKIFLSHGIPILEIMIRSKPDDVVQIFRTIQVSTRFLHHLCCFSKLTKDTSLIAHVPQFRLTLETLVYRVKAALESNNCSAAFWMGILRNRDLHGEDILTQSTNTTEDTVEEVDNEEEELPSDDENEINLDEDESDSDIF